MTTRAARSPPYDPGEGRSETLAEGYSELMGSRSARAAPCSPPRPAGAGSSGSRRGRERNGRHGMGRPTGVASTGGRCFVADAEAGQILTIGAASDSPVPSGLQRASPPPGDHCYVLDTETKVLVAYLPSLRRAPDHLRRASGGRPARPATHAVVRRCARPGTAHRDSRSGRGPGRGDLPLGQRRGIDHQARPHPGERPGSDLSGICGGASRRRLRLMPGPSTVHPGRTPQG